MDPIKKETVIQWLNKINSNFLIESLHNLKEGEPPTVLLNNMKDTSYDVNTKKECFEIIQKFIEDKCDHSLVEQVNFDKDDEVELAKIALLMLKVGLEGEHQEDFIKAALSLNEKSQLEIMSILKGILNGTSANLHIDKLNISKFLEAYDSENSSENDSQEDKATEQSSTASGSKELLDDASPNSNSVNASISSLQKRIPLLTSVGVENEENEQKNKLLRKLDGDLILEQHLRSEMEYDLEEKNKIILLKNDKIQELNNQIRDLKKLQDQLDECKHIKDQYDQLVADTDKLKSQSDELKSLKLENTLLINENAKVYEELNGMKAMKMQLKVAQLDRDKYLEELQLEQRKCFNLQMNLEYKQKVLDEAIHSKNNYQENLVKMTEKYEVLRISYEEKTIALQSEKQPTGESMNVITDLIATELKAELETIKTTWIAPDIHKQLKMELSKVISERNIFKSQWLKSREESLSMKFNKNLFQKDAIKVKSEHGTGQHQLLDEQLTLDILKEDLESFCVRDSNWQQTESIYKSELRHHQVKVTPVKSSLQNFAENSVHATETNISTDNTARKELIKQFEELKRENQNVSEKLELETTNLKEITVLKSKLETVKQSAIEQESKLKGDFEELTKVYTSPLEKKYLETLKEVERINEQLCEKDKRIGELSNFLTEKSSLVEKYQNSNNELKQIVTNLKQNISEKETKTNLLKRELEEKSSTISEKDAKLDELKSIVKERQQKVSEISQKHLSEIITLEEKHKDFKDVQVKLSQKEEELAKQQVEYDSVVAASDKLYGQYGTSVKTYEKLVSKLCNKVESQNRQIECLLEQMSDMKLKAEQEYNIMKRKLIQNDEEVKVSRQEVIKILSAFEEAIRKTKLLEEHQKMLKEKQPTERSMSVMTDHLMTKLMRELEEIKTTWIAPDIHEQLKIVLSKLTSERDLLESKWLKLQEDSLSLKSSNDLLKNEMEKMKIEHGNAQHQLLDKQHTIEKLQTDLKAICVRDSNWQQTGEKCKSELQHQQVKVTPLKSSIQNFVENIVHATKANISTENTAHKKELTKQFEETTDSTEVVTSFKSKLKPAKQSLIEQKSKLKGDFKEHSSLPLVKKYLETLKEVEQINEQLCEKDKRIGELSNFLTEKSSLVEKYQDSNNELTQIVTNLKQNISEKETKANLLKKELEEKSGIISEKDAKLDEFNSIVEGMQQKVLEISQKHLSEIEKLQEILKVEYEEKISSITSEYEYKISNDYVCKSLVEIQEKEHSKELETAKETLYQQYNQKSCCLIEEYEKKLKSVTEDFENRLSTDYVAIDEINEQNKKHIQEVMQMKEKFEEYEVKIKSQDEEHKEALQKVVVEFQEKISENYIAKEVFEAKLKDESIKYTQLEEKYIEKEKKLQLVFKEHEDKLAQVTLNYEEKIATDFVPQQIFQCEQEKHATALEKQEILYKEKLELLDEEQKIFINKKIIEFEDNITTNYVLKSDFEDVYAKLCQKEKEFSEQRAEYDLVVAASDKANDQKKVIEMCNKIESQNRQIKCLQEQIADMTIKGEQEYNGIKRDLSEPEMVKIQNAYEEEIAKCKSLEEQIKVLKGNHNKVITALKETFQSEIKHLKESFLKEYDRRETIYKIDIRKLNDSHLQKLAFSQNKWKEIHQAQCAKISNYEKIVTEKELQVADIKQQLLSEKEARVEFGKYLASSKENHEEEIKKLNSIINETRETYQQLNKNNSMSEAYFHNREQKLMTDHTKTLSKAEERNTSLANCLQISNKELEIFKKKHENISAEIERLTKELMSIKQEKQDVVSKLQDYRVFYILFTAMLCSFLVVPIYS